MGARRAQDLEEANALINFLIEHGAGGNYLEIGARHGWTFYLIAKLVKPMRMLCVDLPGVHPWGDEGSAKILGYVTNLAGGAAVLGDSRDPATIAHVGDWLAGGMVNILFIDGDHKYEGVKADWENYRRFLSPHAFVIFHDINATRSKTKTKDKVIEVDRLWLELKPDYEHWEIDKGSGMGLGIIRL